MLGYFAGELETAQGTLQRCLELDPTSTDANLLMAQIHLSQGKIKECSHSLELGVSHNFQVRLSRKETLFKPLLSVLIP